MYFLNYHSTEELEQMYCILMNTQQQLSTIQWSKAMDSVSELLTILSDELDARNGKGK